MSAEPRCVNVQFADVTAGQLRVRAVGASGRVAAEIGGALYLSFTGPGEAVEFFATGLELVKALP